MSKHTPGPWETAEYSPKDIVANDETMIASARDGMNGITRDEAIANARLIAAAPDLLWTLERILGSLEFEQHLYGEADPKRSTIDFPRAIEMAKKAIAKAIGEQA